MTRMREVIKKEGELFGDRHHHQVDMHVMDAATGAYAGRLCIFGQCPKPGKLECLVPNCGAEPFLQQPTRCARDAVIRYRRISIVRDASYGAYLFGISE